MRKEFHTVLSQIVISPFCHLHHAQYWSCDIFFCCSQDKFLLLLKFVGWPKPVFFPLSFKQSQDKRKNTSKDEAIDEASTIGGFEFEIVPNTFQPWPSVKLLHSRNGILRWAAVQGTWPLPFVPIASILDHGQQPALH